MRRLPSFRSGGLVLEREPRSTPGEARNAYLPAEAMVPLRQHAGAPARPIVQAGDQVREGQLIGRAQGRDSANIHSPIPGLVRGIVRTRLSGGAECDAVAIGLSGSFERLGKPERVHPWRAMKRHELIKSIREAGVVDVESSLPLDQTLSEAEHAGPLDLLVIAALSGEPGLAAERYILEHRRDAIAEGLHILSRLLAPKSAALALSVGDESFAASWDGVAIEEGPELEAFLLPRRYPQHLPNQLLASLRAGKALSPEGRALILSPIAVLDLFEAIARELPSMERYISVGGGAVNVPAILRARIGTSLGELFEECGGFRSKPQRIIVNGAFRGEACVDLDVPIAKTTQAVLALTPEETRARDETACIRCGRCSSVCPEGLDPSRLFHLYDNGLLDRAFDERLGDCSRCGACAFVCPSRIPLSQCFALAQGRGGKTR